MATTYVFKKWKRARILFLWQVYKNALNNNHLSRLIWAMSKQKKMIKCKCCVIFCLQTHTHTQWARKFKKVQAQKLVKSNESFLDFFLTKFLFFFNFKNGQKSICDLILKKNIHEIDLLDFTSFLVWIFF